MKKFTDYYEVIFGWDIILRGTMYGYRGNIKAGQNCRTGQETRLKILNFCENKTFFDDVGETIITQNVCRGGIFFCRINYNAF